MSQVVRRETHPGTGQAGGAADGDHTLRVCWYRTRATFGQRWPGLLAVVLLTALLGGLSMGAFEAARTTESSYTDLAVSLHVPELGLLDGFYNPAIGLDSGYNPALLRTLAHLPHVARVESEVGINAGPVGKNDEPLAASNGVGANGSVNGLGFSADRVIVTEGRTANPTKANEFVLDSATARAFGLHLGERVTIGWVSNATGASEGAVPTFKVPKDHQIRATLVGVGAVNADALFQDQDSASSSTIELFTPAFARPILQCCSNDMVSGLFLRGGTRYLTAVEREVRAVLPKGVPFTYVVATDAEARALRTLKPESIALAVFGGIAGLAALLITGQVIGRRARLSGDERQVLRAIGAGPATTGGDGLIGTLAAVVLGAVVGGVIAIGLSPLAPLGPVGDLLPTRLRVDWTVVGLGVGALAIVLSALAVGVAYRTSPHRVLARITRERGSVVTRTAAAASLPPTAVVGLRFALEPGAGRSSVPVRSAILGAVLAVVVVVGTITFGSSMSTLVSHPALYGWNWTYEIDGGGGLGDIPGHAIDRALRADPLVARWAGVYFSTLQIDGLDVAVMGGTPHAPVGPPLLSGHPFDALNQVVLGPDTLAALHKRIGDTVEVRTGSQLTTLHIVGTATMPSIGVIGSSHLEMGQGALLSDTLIPPGARNVFDVPLTGPNAVLVRMKTDGDTAAGFRSLQHLVAKIPQIQGDGGSVLPVERPAEILNYRTLGATPTLLGVALAAGAVVALGLTLVTSVRRRRPELALLKTLGFTKRQLALTIAWQATVAVVIGCAVGIPLGIALGRSLWDLFVHQISAVPDPTVPALAVALLAVGAIVLANMVAAVPGRIAASTPTAQLLRGE